jgi:hypothetical protein
VPLGTSGIFVSSQSPAAPSCWPSSCFAVDTPTQVAQACVCTPESQSGAYPFGYIRRSERQDSNLHVYVCFCRWARAVSPLGPSEPKAPFRTSHRSRLFRRSAVELRGRMAKSPRRDSNPQLPPSRVCRLMPLGTERRLRFTPCRVVLLSIASARGRLPDPHKSQEQCLTTPNLSKRGGGRIRTSTAAYETAVCQFVCSCHWARTDQAACQRSMLRIIPLDRR